MPARTKKHKHSPALNEKQLIAAGHHLAKSREQFVGHLKMILEAYTGINERFRNYSEFLDQRDEMAARTNIHFDVMDSLVLLQKVLTENTVALDENTDRLDKFLTKFETYFGTDRGLELEN